MNSKFIILFFILLSIYSCQRKHCECIDMQHYINYVQKPHIKSGFYFTGDTLLEDYCGYEVSMPIACCIPEDNQYDRIFETQGIIFSQNNFVYFAYKYIGQNRYDTLIFLDLLLKENETRTVVFPKNQFDCCQDTTHTMHRIAKITMDKIFYSERLLQTIYKFRLDDYLEGIGMSYVIFISKESGIMGHYYFMNKKHKYYINPTQASELILEHSITGDIFEDVFDYSNVRHIRMI